MPPSMVSQPETQVRSGESEPLSEAWALTAKMSPVSNARRFPLAARTSMRDEHPRARIMPMPKSRPPTNAPDRLPLVASCLACETSSQLWVMKSCVVTTAAEKAKSHTANLSQPLRFQNSTTAERRQNLERWAKIPKKMPIVRPASVMLVFSPRASIRLFKSISFGQKFRLTVGVAVASSVQRKFPL